MTGLATAGFRAAPRHDPVIAVPADVAAPAELVQPGPQLAGVDEDFDQAVLRAVG